MRAKSWKIFSRLLPALLLAGPILAAAPGPATDFDDMYEAVAAYMADPAVHPDLARGGVNIYSIRPGYDFTYAYTNLVMAQALVRAYVITGDERYRRRCRDIIETVDRDLWHPGYQGYLAALDLGKYYRRYEKIGPQYNHEYLALSAHNYMAYACLALYEAEGFKDEGLLERARRALAFQKRWLWDGGRLEHDIKRGKVSAPEDYCGGCNLQTLYNILLLKCAMMKEPALGLQRPALGLHR